MSNASSNGRMTPEGEAARDGCDGPGSGGRAAERRDGASIAGRSCEWYCARTQNKREHIAAHWLRARHGIESFLPRIRYRRVEARGAVWTTEALFPNYLFVRCDLARAWQQVQCVPGVTELVRFGSQCPSIPGEVIEGLRALLGAQDVYVIEDRLAPGDAVRIFEGPFEGLEAIVTRVLPAGERVRVLLELLGRQTSVELPVSGVAGIARELRGGLGVES
jgi:transcriptional antiterminator RfaH